MTKDDWETCSDPAAMISYLEQRGCASDFALFEHELFNRIRPEITEPSLIRVIDHGPDSEVQDDARDRIEEMGVEAQDLEFSDPKWQEINRQLEIANAILVYDGQGFAETATDLSSGFLQLFDDVDAEAEWQADTLRQLFPFDYTPSDDE